jgi:hypothetical protein
MGKSFKDEFDVVKGAPKLALGSILATGALVAAVVTLFNTGTIAQLHERVAFKDDQITALESKRDELATHSSELLQLIERMLKRVAALEEKVLTNALESTPGDVELNQSDDQPNLNGTINGALGQSGWTVAPAKAGPPGNKTWASAIRPLKPEFFDTLRAALDESGLQYSQIPDTGGAWLVLDKGQLDFTTQALVAPFSVDEFLPGLGALLSSAGQDQNTK